MALINPFAGTETIAKAPINEDLFDNKVRENLEDLALQIDGVGGGGSDANNGALGTVLVGGETNEGLLWRRRFSPLQHMRNADSDNPTGFNPEGDSLKNELLSFVQNNDPGLSSVSIADYYLGVALTVNKDSSINFKIKKGVNFIAIIVENGTTRCDSVTITIDGVAPSTLGLIDENGLAAPDTFNTNAAATFYQRAYYYYGFDGEEHLVTLENTDSASKSIIVDALDIGYLSPDYTTNETIKINAGKATVRGSSIDFSQFEGTFGNLGKNGHTGAIVLDGDGLVTILDGESPAMTQVKAEEDIAFSSAVTTLPAKNNFYFPDNGICLLSTTYGAHHLFSYESKTDTLIQSHSFDGILWQSQPTVDFSPLVDFNGGTGAARGDLNINYWATAPILIDSTNEKVDFSLTIAGVTTTHAATIANGRYAADLVPLESAFRTAMQTAKSILGEYHLKYDATAHTWSVYVDDSEVEDLQLLFSTGVNSANSLHTTIGFAATNLTGATSYIGSTEKEHLACRVLEQDAVFMHSEDPRIKYSEVTAGTGSITNATNIETLLNLGSIRHMNDGAMLQIYVDADCCGIDTSFISTQNGGMLTYQIDDGDCLYLLQSDDNTHPTTIARSKLFTAMVSFPRGSKKITIRQETSAEFNVEADSERTYFAGARQYFTKPSYEKLTTSQSVIKAIDVSPLTLIGTNYSNNSSVYSPAASNDNINTITENGTWASVGGGTTYFNQSIRRTNTSGGYVEIDFTLVGSGGGISLLGALDPSSTRGILSFLSTSAINETTDKITNTFGEWAVPSAAYWDSKYIGVSGLPAGTYKFRVKSLTGGNFDYSAISVFDTVSPEENKNTVTDISNTGQSVSYPVNIKRVALLKDSAERVPSWLELEAYKEGLITGFNYASSGITFQNFDDSTDLIVHSDHYYSSRFIAGAANTSLSFSALARTIALNVGTAASHITGTQPFIDGIQTLNTVSNRIQVKGGTSPSATRSSASILTLKEFKLTCSHSAGEVFLVADTRGFKNDMKIILDDGTNTEVGHVASFVVGTSFTVKKAPALVVAANVTDVDFAGFHNFDIVCNDASSAIYTSYDYEPLPLTPSKAMSRRNVNYRYEKVGRRFTAVTQGDDLYYPVHSDGVVGNYTTSSIEVTRTSGSTTYFNILQDLKNIGVTNGDIDLKVTSERWVPVLEEGDKL